MSLWSGRARSLSMSFMAVVLMLSCGANAYAQSQPSLSVAPSIDPSKMTPRPGISTPAALSLFNRKTPPFSPEQIPLLASVQREGGKLYYLGERSGLFGWLVVKDGQIQMVYVTADRNSVLVGGMFSAAGDSVSTPQLSLLADTNKEVADVLTPTAMQQRDVSVAGAVAGGAASVPSDPTVAKTASAAPTLGNLLPAVPVSPGERLIMDLRAAASITLGKEGGAELFMIVDPRCPHCRGTWKEMRDYVMNGRIMVHMIPTTIGSGGDDDARISARLLQATDPLKTWDDYVSGNTAALEGAADTLHIRAVQANRGMMDRWNIQATPYLVYRAAKDGQIKIVQGKPERMATVFMDLLKK